MASSMIVPVNASKRTWGQNFDQLLLALLLLGPPVLREARAADTAFVDPLSGLDPTYIVHIGIWGFCGLYVWLLLFTSRKYRGYAVVCLSSLPLRWYALFVVLATLSALYSVYPAYTAFFAVKLWISILIAIRVAQVSIYYGRDPLTNLLRTTFLAYVVGFFLLSILFVFAPELVSRSSVGVIGIRLTGGIFNDYGSYSLFSLVALAVWYSWRRRGILAYYLGFPFFMWALLLLLLAQTRTTLLLAAGACVLILFGVGSPLRRLLGLAILGSLSVCIFIFGGETLPMFLARGQDLESLASLSGRTYLFTFLIEHWRESPFIGYGFHAASRYTAIRFLQETGLYMGSAHDALSKVLVDLGVLGAVVLCIALLAFWRRVWRLRLIVRRELWILIVVIGMYGITHSITGGGIAEPLAIWPVMFLMPGLAKAQESHASFNS